MEVSDIQSAPFRGVVSITPGTPLQSQRSIGYICTAAGNATFTLLDGSTLTIPLVTAGGAFQTLPFAVTNITLGGGTAGTFWQLK